MDINKICPGCMKEIENRESAAACPNCGYNLKNIGAEPHQLQPFTILAGKYLVGKVIGEGGFGISYLGIDLNLEIPVAIKEFYPNGFVTRESNHSTRVSLYSGKNESDVNKWREGFINEARNLAKFSNLNGIVEVRDFFNENNTAYIVMEFIDGITLKQYLKQNGGKIPVDKTFEMMKPVIKSMSKVHDAGMIHRDISPDNIMITKFGGMKLLDFGAARDFAGNAEKSLSIMLKPGYAPEEQYRSRGKQGPWSDVYALTATIYKCITGITPVESMERMRQDSLKSPKELGIKISDIQDAAIRQGMAVYAENRFQSMDALYAALYSDNNPQPQPLPPQPQPQPQPYQQPQPRPQADVKISDAQKKILLAGGVAILGVLLVLVCVMAMPKGDSRKKTASSLNYHQDSNSRNTPAVNADVPASDSAVQPVSGNTVQVDKDSQDDSVDITAQVNEISSSISDYDSAEETGSALDKFLELAAEYGNIDNLGEQVYKVYGFYQDAMLERINNCNSQEPSAALYTQISSDIDAAYGYVQQFERYGIGVNSGELDSVGSNFKMNYKSRLIDNFDSYAASEIQNNGIVSRSELWTKMEGINNTDLYDQENPDDPLRLRYASALALYTDSELDKLGDVGNKIGKVYGVLKDTDYCPYLIYRLATECDDTNAAEWYRYFSYYTNDIEYFSNTGQKNFMYYYYTDQGYQTARQSFREYMSGYSIDVSVSSN